MEPFDIFMPTYNSAELLPIVIPQIEKVIPREAIHNKFIVDDFSTDNTCAVAKSLGWTVYRNKTKGLCNSHRLGFSLIKTGYCALFEHDIFLAENWYPTIPNMVTSGKYDVAQGIQIRNLKGFREVDLYDYNHRNIKSEDNTFYRIRNVPDQMEIKGRKYCIRKDVVSTHIRKGTLKSAKHGYYVTKLHGPVTSKLKLLIILLHSPLLSLAIYRKYKEPATLYCYPLERLYTFIGRL